MDLGIRGRCALVLAGGGGLGGGVARMLASEGAKVAVADVNEEAARMQVDAIIEHEGVARAYACDLSRLETLDELLAAIKAEMGEPLVLVNLTGGPPSSGATEDAPAIWTRHFQTMVNSIIYMSALVLPAMRLHRWGRIITSTSSGVLAPIPDLAISNSLRMALLGWSKTLAREVAPDGVTVNVVVPGRIGTRRVAELDQLRSERNGGRPIEEVIRESCKAIPIGRYGTVDEYAALVTFLASSHASYITGSVLRVDGGLVPSIL